MARGGEGLETKMGTLGSGTGASGGTGGGSGGRITGAGAMEIGGSTTGGGVATISGGRDGTGGGLMARRRISATCAYALRMGEPKESGLWRGEALEPCRR